MLKESAVGFARHPLFQLVHEQRRPCVHRRVDVAEVPLIDGQLAVGVEVTAVEEQAELLFGEGHVDDGEGHRVKGEVPGREPRVLPLIRHGNDVFRVQVLPLVIAEPGIGEERVAAVFR